MMIQEQPPLPQPHMEERLLSFTLLSYGEPQKVLQKLSQPRIIYEYCLERHLRHAKSDCRASAACAAFLHSAEKIFAALYQLE